MATTEDCKSAIARYFRMKMSDEGQLYLADGRLADRRLADPNNWKRRSKRTEARNGEIVTVRRFTNNQVFDAWAGGPWCVEVEENADARLTVFEIDREDKTATVSANLGKTEPAFPEKRQVFGDGW